MLHFSELHQCFIQHQISPAFLSTANSHLPSFQAFSIINVVQLIDTICDTICSIMISSLRLTLIYFPVSVLWHWFTSGVFSMVLFDRYMMTSNSSLPLPGLAIVPSADLSSLWFKNMFEWFNKANYGDPDIGFAALIICLFVFGIPFLLRLGAGAVIYGEID
jgi:hypothetical protein